VAQAVGLARARTETENEIENLPVLLSRLGDQVTELVDTKIDLLKVEVKEEANTYIQGGIMIGLGAVVAVVGFALVNVAVALAVSLLFASYGMAIPASYAAGFVTTGIFYLILGGIVITVMKNRLAKEPLVPTRTVEELRKDKQWLTKEL
jgi:uncharacterized membrane protein YqjE